MNPTLHAPQILMLGLMILGLGISLAQHGEPRTGKHNLMHSIIGCAIQFGLMYWGGFFS